MLLTKYLCFQPAPITDEPSPKPSPEPVTVSCHKLIGAAFVFYNDNDANIHT